MFTRAGCCGRTVRIRAKAGPDSSAHLRPLVDTMRTDGKGEGRSQGPGLG